MKNYISGFIISIALTLTAFALVMQHLLTGGVLIFTILALAVIQLWIQLIFFLHLDHENGPRWNLAVFISTIGVVLILILGSLWIMYNLNKYHMTPSEVDSHILHDEGIYDPSRTK